MHILDGFLPPSVSLTGYFITGGLTGYVLKKINKENRMREKVPKASLLTAAFFVASLIHIPLGGISIHLVLNGMLGILLGYYAFIAILIGLLFQAIMFQHGGLSTLGINGVVMGVPALIAHFIFQIGQKIKARWVDYRQFIQYFFSFLGGACAVGLSGLMFSGLMLIFISEDLNKQAETIAIYTSAIFYGIQMIIEGSFTVMVISFLGKVKPELLKI